MTKTGWNVCKRSSCDFLTLGISDDMAGLSLIELWGLYRFLSRLADG